MKRCVRNLLAVSSLCRFCISKMQRMLSRAWWGLSSFIKWCMLMNRFSMSSSFWSRSVLNVCCWLFRSICCWSNGSWVFGAFTKISKRSKYAISMEWLSFFSSFLWLFMLMGGWAWLLLALAAGAVLYRRWIPCWSRERMSTSFGSICLPKHV